MDFPGFRKNFSTEDLATYMGREFKIDGKIVAKLMEEEIDGLALLQLTEVDLRELGINKMGTLKKVMLLIRQNIGQSVETSNMASVPGIAQPPEWQMSRAVLEVMKRIGDIDNKNHLSLPSNLVGRGNNATPIPSPYPMDVKPVIDLTTSSPHQSPVHNPSPETVRTPSPPKTPIIDSTSTEQPFFNQIPTPDVSSTSSFEPPRIYSIVPKRRYTLIDSLPVCTMVPQNLFTPPIRKTNRKASLPKRYVTLSNNNPQMYVPPLAEGDTTSQIVDQSVQTLPFVMLPSSTSTANMEAVHSIDSTQPKIVKVKTLRRKGPKIEPVYELPIGVTVENIELIGEISKIPYGKQTVKEIFRDGHTNTQAHRKLIKFAVMILDKVSESVGHRKYYPPSYFKTEMAKAMLRCFPILSHTKKDFRYSMCQYYHSGDRKGYIENRYKTIRQSLTLTERAYKPRAIKKEQKRTKKKYDNLMNSLE